MQFFCDQCNKKAVGNCLRCNSAACRDHARRGRWRGRVGPLCTYCAEYEGVMESKHNVPAGSFAGGRPPESPRDLLSAGAIAASNAFGGKSDLWLMWYFGDNVCDVPRNVV